MSAPPGTRAVARPGRCSPPHRDHARLTRLWADATHLHLVGPGLHERRRLGGDGLTEVVHVDTSAYDLDHGADPLDLIPGGWIELPAQEGAPLRRLAVRDWLSDQDRVTAVEVSDPLAASNLGPVLDAAGISVVAVRRRRQVPAPADGASRRGRLLARGEGVKLAAVLLGAACGLLALYGAPAAPGLGAVAVALAAGVILAIRIPQARRRLAERGTGWTASAELRPARRSGCTRGFARHVRLAVCGAELVLVDGAGGELWLGGEELTGVCSLVVVTDDGAPLRVELRRADGTSLARLPWVDWFAGDGGAALRAFAARRDLPVAEEPEADRSRDLRAALGNGVEIFGSDGTWYAQQRQSDLAAIGLAPGRMPGMVAALPALLAAVAAPGESGGLGIAACGAAVVLAAVGPAVVDGIRRRLDRRTIP